MTTLQVALPVSARFCRFWPFRSDGCMNECRACLALMGWPTARFQAPSFPKVLYMSNPGLPRVPQYTYIHYTTVVFYVHSQHVRTKCGVCISVCHSVGEASRVLQNTNTKVRSTTPLFLDDHISSHVSRLLMSEETDK